MVSAIFWFILCLPLYAVLIWQYVNPEEAMLWGKRWMYNDEPQITESAVRYTKLSSLFGIIFISIILVILFLNKN